MMNPANTPRRTSLSVSHAEPVDPPKPKPCGDCPSCRFGEPQHCEYAPGLITDFADMVPGRRYRRLRSGVYAEVTD